MSNCFVVNCAAYTAVDKAELEIEAAYRVNAIAPEYLAATCNKIGAPLLHISTDYVFDGASSGAWKENDQVQPLSVYGRSKLAGETAVRTRHPLHIILRTSWVFSSLGTNFVTTMLRISREQRHIRVVNDQFGGPTAAEDIASAILAIMETSQTQNFGKWGTYHYSGSPSVSWYEFANAVLADTSIHLSPIKTAEYRTLAKRPLNSVLDCSRIAAVFGLEQPDWRPSLRRVTKELSASS
jgi:dTDP-4-dehydrorhamnose reductase